MATYNANISVKVAGLSQLKNLENRVQQLQERFTKLNAAAARITAPFQGHIKALTEINKLLRENNNLLNQQSRIASSVSRGSRGGGGSRTDAKVQAEVTDQLNRQIRLLKDRARQIDASGSAMQKLLKAEVEINAQVGGNVRLGRQLIKNARELISAEEQRARAVEASAARELRAKQEVWKLQAKALQEQERAEARMLDARAKNASRAARDSERSSGGKRGGRGPGLVGRFGGAMDNAFGGVFSKATSGATNSALRFGAAGALMTTPFLGASVRGLSNVAGPLKEMVDGLGQMIQMAHDLPGGVQAAIAALVAFSPIVAALAEKLPAAAQGVYKLGQSFGSIKPAQPLKTLINKSGGSFMESVVNPLSAMSMKLPAGPGAQGPGGSSAAAFGSNLGLQLVKKAADEMLGAVQAAADKQEQARQTAQGWAHALQQGQEWIRESTARLREFEQAQSEAARKRLTGSASPQAFDDGGVRRRTVSGSYASPAGPAGSPSAVEGSVQNMVNRMRERVQAETAAGKAAAQTTFQYRLQIALANRMAAAANKVEMELLAGAAAMEKELKLQQRIEQTILRIRRAKREERVQELRGKRDSQGQRAESLALGVGFPLMFGAGPGSIAGSLAGSFMGSGFGGQIAGGAIGQIFDQFAAGATDMGKMLRDPITNFEKLSEAGLLASKSQEYYISKLIEVGRVTEAAAIIQGEMVKKIGAGGVNDLTRLGDSSDRAAKAWAELNLQMQAAVSGPLADLLDWVAKIVGVAAEGNRKQAAQTDFLSALNKANPQAYQRYFKESIALRNANGGTVDEAKLKQLQQRYIQQYGLKPGQPNPTAIDPKALEDGRRAAQQVGDQIKAAYREAFDLQRRGADIQREMVDYRRKVESDIFAKQQEAKRLEIDNARKAAQINIEQTDLALRKQFAGSQGLTGELLNGVRAYIAARRSGEADIEQKRRQLEVNLADITKATADYAYEQANRRMQLERSIEDYKRDIADYQLKIARQIQELAPIGGGGGGGAPVGNLGGFAGLSRLIGGHESYGGNYGAFNRGGSNNGHTARGSGVDPNLVNMTIAEIQRRQLAPGIPANQQLHAVGKYQIIGSTLSRLLAGRYGPTGVSANDKFSPDVQERLGSALARNRMVPGNVDASVRGLRQEWIGLQYANTDQLRAAVRQFQGAPATQFGTAAASVTAPTFHAPAANTAGFADAQSRVAEAQKKSVELERQHNELKQQAAAFDVQEIARGQSQVQQTQRQLELEKAKLATLTSTGGLSENEVALLAQQLEGESKIAEIITAQKDALLAINTAVKEGVLKQTEADVLIKQINLGVEKRLEATRTQIGLEQELLKVQQAQQLAVEAQAMQRKLMTTGQGMRAGYTGGAASQYESILGRTGDSGMADKFAQAQQIIDRTEQAMADASSIGGTIAGGFKDAIKAAVTGGDIKAAFANMLGSLGEKFLEMAFRPIEQALTQAVFGMLAPSNSQMQAAQIMLAAAQQQIQAATMMAGSGGGGGFGGAGGILGGLGSLFGGGGMWGAASGVAFNPIAFTPGLSFFAEGGFVTGPTPAVVGEGGANEYVIPENKMGSAMARWSGGARGDSVVNGADPTGGGGTAVATAPPQVNITGGILNFNDSHYIRADQVPSIINQASKAGEQRAMTRLKNSPSSRRKIGL